MKNPLINLLSQHRNPISLALLLLLSANVLHAQNYITPPLGRCASFVLYTPVGALADTGALTSIIGDIGANLGAVSNYDGGKIAQGSKYNADTVTAKAAIDVQKAYDYLKALRCTDSTQVPAMGSGLILFPGVYQQLGASSIVGDLILDAQNQFRVKFIFQINGAFTSAASAHIILRNGAEAANVYWVVNGAAAFAANSQLIGTVIAHGAVSLGDGTSLVGRGLSIVGAISTYNNVITKPALPLPVELVAFAVKSQTNSTVLLTWSTASEKNSSYFDIERSVDGISFIRIGTIDALGNSIALHNYSWSDMKLPNTITTTFYYRLHQFDVNGTSAYSPIRSLSFKNTTTVLTHLTVFPNPAHEFVQVEVNGKAPIEPLKLVDLNGRNIPVTPLLGVISLSNIPTGLYIIYFGTLSKRFIHD